MFSLRASFVVLFFLLFFIPRWLVSIFSLKEKLRRHMNIMAVLKYLNGSHETGSHSSYKHRSEFSHNLSRSIIWSSFPQKIYDGAYCDRGSIWTELGSPCVRGNFHLHKLASKWPLTSVTAPPQLFMGWDMRSFHLPAIPAWMQGTWRMLTTRGEFQGGMGPNGIIAADISNWFQRSLWFLPICSRWEVSIQWISPFLISPEPGLWEEWIQSGRNRRHLLSCKTSSYKFPELSGTPEDQGRSNLDLHWIPYHCLPPLTLHRELLQAHKRKTDSQTDKKARRFPRTGLWFGP